MKRSAVVVWPARIFTPVLNYGQTGERALLPCYVSGIFGTLIKMLSNTDFLLRPLHTVAREEGFVSGYNWMTQASQHPKI